MHMLILGVVVLIFIGPKELPEVARVVGRLLNELRRTVGDLSRTVMDARDQTNKYLEEQRSQIASAAKVQAQQQQAEEEHKEWMAPGAINSDENESSAQIGFDLEQSSDVSKEKKT